MLGKNWYLDWEQTSGSCHRLPVNTNKQKTHLNSWSLEPRRENSHTCVTQHTLLTQTGRDIPCIFYGKWSLLPQLEEEKIPLCPVTTQPMENSHNSANEKSTCSKLSVSFYWLFVYNSLSLIHKRSFLFFVSLDLHILDLWFVYPKLQFFVVHK